MMEKPKSWEMTTHTLHYIEHLAHRSELYELDHFIEAIVGFHEANGTEPINLWVDGNLIVVIGHITGVLDYIKKPEIIDILNHFNKNNMKEVLKGDFEKVVPHLSIMLAMLVSKMECFERVYHGTLR